MDLAIPQHITTVRRRTARTYEMLTQRLFGGSIGYSNYWCAHPGDSCSCESEKHDSEEMEVGGKWTPRNVQQKDRRGGNCLIQLLVEEEARRMRTPVMQRPDRDSDILHGTCYGDENS